jgi:hypothetical protein
MTAMPGNQTLRSANLFSLISRIAAAVFGGYALATALSIALSRSLPLPRAEAVLTGMLLSFAVYAAAILWAFTVRTARRAWLGMLVPAGVFGAISWLLRAGGAS